jgi:hypothetical protein
MPNKLTSKEGTMKLIEKIEQLQAIVDERCQELVKEGCQPSSITIKNVIADDEYLLENRGLVGELVRAWKQENKGQAGGKIAEWKQDSELLHRAIEHMDDAVLGRDPDDEIDWRVLCLDVYAIAKGEKPGSLADEEL